VIAIVLPSLYCILISLNSNFISQNRYVYKHNPRSFYEISLVDMYTMCARDFGMWLRRFSFKHVCFFLFITLFQIYTTPLNQIDISFGSSSIWFTWLTGLHEGFTNYQNDGIILKYAHKHS